MSDLDHLPYDRRLELNAALEAGESFVAYTSLGELVEASRALTKARRCLDGNGGACQMCGGGDSKYCVCEGCFFVAHTPDKLKAVRECISLLNSMILSGEDHSVESKLVLAKAKAALGMRTW